MMKTICSVILLVFLSHSAFAKKVEFFVLGRSFTLVVPKGNSVEPRPLLVLLHGCKQNPSLFLEGTRMAEEALEGNFFVLAPEQPEYYNIDHCWNWFIDFHQQRIFGNEMSQIIGGIKFVQDNYKIESESIYVAGISAGAAMAHNLMTCYPDLFSGAAVHSGLNYKTAENIQEAQTVLTSYDQKSPEYLGKKMYECSRQVEKSKLKKIIIIHGLNDSRVPSLHSELISKSELVWRDFVDDGKRNRSVTPKITTETLSFANNYRIEKTDSSYPDLLERRLMIHNLGHAWGGGKPISVNFDPAAPSSNDLILRFFDLKK